MLRIEYWSKVLSAKLNSYCLFQLSRFYCGWFWKKDRFGLLPHFSLNPSLEAKSHILRESCGLLPFKLRYTGNSLIYFGLRINWNLKELRKKCYYWTPIKAKYSISVPLINNHSNCYCHSCFMFTLCIHSSKYFIQIFFT